MKYELFPPGPFALWTPSAAAVFLLSNTPLGRCRGTPGRQTAAMRHPRGLKSRPSAWRRPRATAAPVFRGGQGFALDLAPQADVDPRLVQRGRLHAFDLDRKQRRGAARSQTVQKRRQRRVG